MTVAASRRRRPQRGHVRHAASADRCNLTTSPTPPPPPAPGAAAAAVASQARTALSMPPAGRARARSDVGTASRLLPCRLSPASRWPAASISSAHKLYAHTLLKESGSWPKKKQKAYWPSKSAVRTSTTDSGVQAPHVRSKPCPSIPPSPNKLHLISGQHHRTHLE